MSFFKHLLQLFTNAEEIRDEYTGISINEILDWIKKSDELRFYVDATANFGHQASTIHLMKRLIDETGYTNEIKVIYNNVDPDSPDRSANTPDKLAILLTGLNPSDIDSATITYGTCKRITFLDYKNKANLEGQIYFGFTGGADDMKINYATELKVKYFLRLQPYLWDDEWQEKSDRDDDWETSRVEQSNDNFFYLPQAYENFLSLVYKFAKDKFTTVNDDVWKWYSEAQAFNSKLKFRTKNIRAIYDCYQHNKSIHLWPLYGLHQFRYRVDCFNELPTMAMNFVLAAFEAQKTIKKPIVIFSMNKLEDIQESFETYIPAFAKDLKDEAYDLEAFKNKLEKQFLEDGSSEKESIQGKINQFVKQLAIDVKPLIESNSKITTLIGDKDISADLTSAIEQATNNQIIIALIGSVPVDIYNYFYANCQIPGVFEGQGTSSLVISLGRPFLQLIRDSESIKNNYPSTLASTDYSKLAITANNAGLQLRNQQYENYLLNGVEPNEYYAGLKGTATFITNSLDTNSEIYQYFTGLGTYYQKNIHDKFMLGLVALNSLIRGFDKSKLMLLQASVNTDSLTLQETSKLTLENVFNQLTQNWSNGEVSLKGALPQTYLTEFFSQVTNTDFFITVDKGNIKVEKDGDAITKVTLSNGTTSAFKAIDIPLFNVNLTFTVDDGPVVTQVQGVIENTWNIDGVPWISFDNPGFTMKVNEGGIPVQGGLTGTVKGTDLALEIVYPTQDDSWLIKGGFQKDYPGIDTFYQMAGGINLIQALPSPLSELTGFGLKNIQLMYNQRTSQFTYMAFEMTTQSPWAISQTPLLQITPTVTVSINNVQDVERRETMFLVSGNFTIGKGTITVNGGYPNFELYGGLSSGEIMLSDLLGLFGGELELTSAVTQFNFAYKPKKKYYQIGATLEDDEPLRILNLFTINSLSFNVESSNNLNTVFLGGTFTLLPNAEEITIRVQGLYSTNAGWTFTGQQISGVVPIGALLKEYLGWETTETWDIDGLGITIETKTNSYEFTGKTAEPWSITPLGLSVTASMKVGYNGGTQSIGPGLRISKAEMPLLIMDESVARLPALTSEAPATGSYGEISAEIIWNNIALLVAYNFDPTVKSFEVTWGIFTGKIEEKQIDGKKSQIATLKFTQTTTLGSMIEIMVSWATGSKFSLSAPWNLLDKINLSNFELVYNFTNETVQIKINIGPIDLGFATINSIGLSYEKSSAQAAEKSVMIDLDASFIWGEKIPKWDATKPETTPSPEGSGNKYLDLRMLAMGQHVTFDGFKDATTVQKAIALMAKMPEPKSDEVPAVTFDADSSWLFAADFGVLRVGDTANYTLNLQTIFNDPNLYALRIALDKNAPAAKIFKGLDFQIMYRKLSDTLGVYQSEITLPDVMRHLTVGAYSITLPVFGIEIYTNGDFKVDIGFPWNENFARSFTVEAIVPPGIPLTGSGGIYFGKVPQISADVPVTTKGHFNPVFVIGFGAQVGLGKSIQYGILKAGFSLTVFGILEGLLAKWNPYDGTSTGNSNAMQLQGEYYFSMQGTFGLIGKIYGSVDFVVIKADVNITIKVFAQITFASYQPIPISVVASVDATASISINFGFFSIHIHFSFSIKVKETFVIGAVQNPNDAPWLDNHQGVGRLASPLSARLRGHALALNTVAVTELVPVWSRLTAPAAPIPLDAYLAFAPTVAGDDAFDGTGTPDKSKQLPCYIASLFIKSVPAATGNDHTSALKAEGKVSDSAFEILAKMVVRWGIAAIQDSDVSPATVDNIVVSDDRLKALLTYLEGTPEHPIPLPYADIETFITNQLQMILSLPENGTSPSSENAAFFPMALPLTLDVPAYNGSTALNYRFDQYNTLDADFISWLRDYFNQLAVQVQQEGGQKNDFTERLLEGNVSLAQFVFSDYFLLIMKQMLQAMREGLRSFKYLIKKGDKGNNIVSWINTTGKLNDAFQLDDLFQGNADHTLNSGAVLVIPGMIYSIAGGDTFDAIAAKAQFNHSFTAQVLAANNAQQAGILNSGQTITYPRKDDYKIDGAVTLQTIADKVFLVSLDDLLDHSNILTAENLLAAFASLALPKVNYTIEDGDTLNNIASTHGVKVNKDLSITENGNITDLFEITENAYLDLVHLPQFQVGELIKEAQCAKAIEHLSGMASRYYLHGLRLPTDKITPNKQGMWVKNNNGALSLPLDAGLFALTGQQFSIPTLVAKQALTITLSRPETLKWLIFNGGGDRLVYTLKSDDRNYQSIRALHTYASQHALDTGLKSLGAESMVDSDASTYPLSSSTPCQITAAIDYPVGGVLTGEGQPRLWSLPDAMQSLPPPAEQSADNVLPDFELQVHRYNEATATSESTDIQHYGWATSLEFTIKRLPKTEGESAYNDSYEIMGADGTAALLLERMAQIGNEEAIALLTLAYTVKSGADSALRLATGADITLGISQSNLSTTTRPPTMMLAEMVGTQSELPTLLNTKKEFIQYLWKASITRNGGFYLYYNEKDQDGLSDLIFNDKGEASLSLFVLYADNTVGLHSYMNASLIGDPINTSTGAIIAKAVSSQLAYVVSEADSPEAITKRYYSSILSLVQHNPDMTLSSGVTYILANGSYQVPLDGSPPGGSLEAIASYFSMDAQTIKDANPRVDWSKDLAVGSAIRLPQVNLTVSTSPGGTSLQSIAAFYGTSGAAILGANGAVLGLINAGQTLNVSKGPFMQSSTEMPGVQAIGANRQALPTIPASTDPDYAKDYLLHLYTLLAYRVDQNQDFVHSKMGLPLGPKGEPGSGSMDKIRFVKSMNEMDSMTYSKGIPYANLISAGNGHAESITNPYQANGRLLQMDYSWNDLYGNRLVTQLDEGILVGNKNPKAPVLTGYTDGLVGLSQWPGTSSHWTVTPKEGVSDDFKLEVTISFDPSPYNKSASDTSDGWKTRAKTALVTYEKLLAQLTDPNGIAILFKTGLLITPISLPADQIGTLSSATSTLIGWLLAIKAFLKQRATGQSSAIALVTNLVLSATAQKANLNPEQVFVIDFEFIIKRTQGIAEGDFAAMPAVREIATPIIPLMEVKVKKDDDTGANNDNPGLDLFAENIEDTLSSPGEFTLTVGTGEDRTKADAGGSNSTVWAVRLGENDGEGIYFSINEYDPDHEKGTPQIFAPRPVLNQLKSDTVNVYPYSKPDDFDPADNNFTTTPTQLSFTDVDMDNWVRQFFTSIDHLLSPEYLSSMLVIDQKTTAHPEGISSFMQSFSDQKKALANVAGKLMSTVYENQDSSLIGSAQEALYQVLLEKLSNLYSTRAVVSFSADVKADAKISEAYDNPQLYGNVAFNDSSEDNSQIILTSPKLALATQQATPLTFLVEAPALPKTTGEGILSSLTLDLKFQGAAIEHQISSITGVENYKASTWLGLVRTATTKRLQARLGHFEIPMFIRSFPAKPRMDLQTGVPFETTDSKTSLADLTAWNYAFTYSQDYHYAQDKVYGEIEYNLTVPTDFALYSSFPDAFDALAQFISVKPKLEKLLKENIPQINAQTTDATKIDDAAKVLGAFLKMVSDVTAKSSDKAAFEFNRPVPRLTGNEQLAYQFYIEENSYTFKPAENSSEITAWVVKITSTAGVPPAGLLPRQYPVVDIPGDHIVRKVVPDNTPQINNDPTKGIYAFWYSQNGKPITGDEAQIIQGRTVTIPGLNILNRQDAKSTIYLKRNEELVLGHPSADEFIYQTPRVSFTNALLPTIDHSQPVDITKIPSSVKPKTLAVYLSNLFKSLFETDTQSTQTIQLECQYAYSLSEAVEQIKLPVLMLPPLSIDPSTDFIVPSTGCPSAGQEETFVCKLSNQVIYWFNQNNPSQNKGVFYFDLTVMSHLTEQPMPLIRLRSLYLRVDKIPEFE